MTLADLAFTQLTLTSKLFANNSHAEFSHNIAHILVAELWSYTLEYGSTQGALLFGIKKPNKINQIVTRKFAAQ
jgi:hypothetical protein